jgi:hypothetical protein
VSRNGAPSGEEWRPMGAATIATDHVSEGFRPDEHQSNSHRPGCGNSTPPAASATSLPEEVRHSPKPHPRATGKHPPTPQLHHHDSAGTAGTTKKRGGAPPAHHRSPCPSSKCSIPLPLTTPGRDGPKLTEVEATNPGHHRPAQPRPSRPCPRHPPAARPGSGRRSRPSRSRRRQQHRLAASPYSPPRQPPSSLHHTDHSRARRHHPQCRSLTTHTHRVRPRRAAPISGRGTPGFEEPDHHRRRKPTPWEGPPGGD